MDVERIVASLFPIGTVYGLRERGADAFFYVGCTRNTAAERLRGHLDAVRLGGHTNAEFVKAIQHIGAANVETVELEQVGVDELFDCEEYWISRYFSEGHPLVNVRKIPEMYRIRFDPYRVKRQAWKVLTLYAPRKPKTWITPPNHQALAEKFERLAIMCAKKLLNSGDEWLAYIGYLPAKPVSVLESQSGTPD